MEKINATTYVHLTVGEVKALKTACKIVRTDFTAMACRPKLAREMIAEAASLGLGVFKKKYRPKG